MSLGNDVSQSTINYSCAQAALDIRKAFDEILIINQWLNNNPIVEGVDILVTDPTFAYTDDEATTLRTWAADWATVYAANTAALTLGSEMTGLQ